MRTAPTNNHAELMRANSTNPNPASAINALHTSIIAVFAIYKVTCAISAIAAAVTPARNADAPAERRNLPANTDIATAIGNDGKKIPAVAAAAPAQLCVRYPINVAVANTGPGVSCPAAIAS